MNNESIKMQIAVVAVLCYPDTMASPVSRPGKSGKWRECRSRKILDCEEVSQHKNNKTK